LRLRLHAEIPIRAVYRRTRGSRPVHDRNGVAACIGNRELHRVTHTWRETIRELCTVGRARSLEGLLSNFLAFDGRFAILERGGRREEVRSCAARCSVLHLL